MSNNNKEKLDILRVVQSVYPEVLGGVGIHVHELSKSQAELGHNITILTSDNGVRELDHFERREGYTIKRFKEIARPVENSITPGIIPAILSCANDYDIIDIHSHLYFMSNVSSILSRFTNTKTVLTNHGLVSQTAPNWLHKLYNPTIGKSTFKGADHIICLSKTDRERLRTLGIEVPITEIPSGIDSNTFYPDPKISEKDQILFVGRLNSGKRPELLLDAYNKSKVKDYCNLKIVGDGPKKKSLEEKAKKYNIEENVDIESNISEKLLIKRYNESKLYILTSSSEGLPRTVLESMACETTVIVSPLEQLENLVDGAGRVVDPTDTDELARAIDEIVNNDNLRKEYGKKARDTVMNGYTWENTVKETTKLYYNVKHE